MHQPERCGDTPSRPPASRNEEWASTETVHAHSSLFQNPGEESPRWNGALRLGLVFGSGPNQFGPELVDMVVLVYPSVPCGYGLPSGSLPRATSLDLVCVSSHWYAALSLWA